MRLSLSNDELVQQFWTTLIETGEWFIPNGWTSETLLYFFQHRPNEMEIMQVVRTIYCISDYGTEQWQTEELIEILRRCEYPVNKQWFDANESFIAGEYYALLLDSGHVIQLNINSYNQERFNDDSEDTHGNNLT